MIIIKKIICLLCVMTMLCTTAFAESDIRIYVNGMRLNDDVIVANDRTYVPVRAVSESMGADVLWDGTSRSVFITFTEDELIAQLVSDVSSSVVSIIGNYTSTDGTGGYNNPTVHGSGVIYSSNGYIVTNAHVVENIKNLTVVLNNGTMLPATVLYSDKEADLAIIKIDKIGLNPIVMADKNTILSGKTAIAIGTPISMSMRNTVTKGIVCGNDVSLPDSYYKLIQTDATVNPGNSGGPLLNTKGELIGINSSKYAGVGIDNMAFAIPVDTVQYVISQYERYGRVMRPQLNITLEQSWEAKIGLPTKKGITVKTSSNPLLKSSDVITDVNGIEVHSISDWNEAIKDSYNVRNLDIGITRNSQTIRINVEC